MNLNKFTVILAILLVSILAIGAVSAETVDDSDIVAVADGDIQESVDITDPVDDLSTANNADETVGDDSGGPNDTVDYDLNDDTYSTYFNEDGTATDALSADGNYYLNVGTLTNKDIKIVSGQNVYIQGKEGEGFIKNGTITIGNGAEKINTIQISGITFINNNKDAIVVNQYSEGIAIAGNNFDLTYDDTYPSSPMAIVTYGFVNEIDIVGNNIKMNTAGMYSYGIDLTIYTPNWGPQGDSNPNNIFVADNEIYIDSSSASGMAEGMYLDSLTNSVIENNYIYVYTVGDAANYGMQLADSCAYNYMSEDEGISPCNVTIKNNTVVLDSNDMAYGITAISASPYDGDFQEYVKNIVISGNDVTVTSAKGAIGIGTSSADAAITDNKVTVSADASAVNNAYIDSYFGGQSYAIYVNNFNEMNGYFHNNTVANNVIVSNVPAVAVNKTEEDDERVLPLVIENNEVINSILIDDDSYATYFDENGNIKDDAPITAGDVLLLGDLTNKKLVIDTGLTIRGVPNKKLVNCTIKLIEGADGTIIDGLNMEFTGDESSGGFGVIAAFEVSNIAITNNTVRILDSKGTGYAMAIQIQGLVEGCDNVTVSGNIIDFKGSTAGMYGIDVYTKWQSDAVNTNFVITDNVIDIEGATAMAEPIYLNTVNGVIVSNNILNSQGGEGADAYGIGAPSANNAVIENNIIVAKGTKMTYGISNTKSENVTIRNNDITAEGVGAVGVGLSQDSNVEVSDNKIAIEGGDYNTITTYDSVGTANAGVYVKDDNEDIKVSGNDVSEKSPLRSNTAIEANNISVTAAPSGNGSYEITLRTAGGMILANQVVKVVFNNQMYELTTDDNGVAVLPFALNKGGTYNVDVFYLGDDDYRGSDASAKLTINKIATKTTAAGKTYLATAKTKSLTATLKDANGNVLANKKVTFTVNGKTYTATTNAKGVATVKLALTAAKTYTVTIKFAGDNVYAASTVSAKVKLNKEKTKVTAPKKTFKRSKKVKKVVINLKNSKGKAVAKKKITLTVNKKKYTAKTNKKGKATIKVKLTKKGTFKYKVKFAGDTQYKAAKKNGKIKIK